MSMMEQYSNGASTTIAEDLDASETGVDVTSASGFPTIGNFRVLVGSEIMLVTGVSGTTFTVVRGAEGTTAATHTNGDAITHIVTRDSLRAVLSTLYGTGWRQKMATGDWAWINQGSATVNELGGVLSLYAPATASNNVRIQKRSAPSPPYTISATVGMGQWDGQYYNFGGIGWRQSSDGKLILFGITLGRGFTVQKYSSATAYNSSYTLTLTGTPTWGAWSNRMSLRIVDDNSSRKCLASPNGIDWFEIHSVGRTDYLTGDEVLFFAESNNATYPVITTLYSWEVE